MPDIHSVDDLEPWLALIKEKEPDFVPFYTQGDGIPIEGIEDITSGLGIFYDDKSLTVKNMYETEELKHQRNEYLGKKYHISQQVPYQIPT